MLAKEYGHKSPWVGIGAYSVATGLMRMANNKHWLSDVLAGAGIGILSTELGYFLADLIFKEKGISTIDASGSFDRMYKPSFLGLYIGINIPLNGYRPPLGTAQAKNIAGQHGRHRRGLVLQPPYWPRRTFHRGRHFRQYRCREGGKPGMDKHAGSRFILYGLILTGRQPDLFAFTADAPEPDTEGVREFFHAPCRRTAPGREMHGDEQPDPEPGNELPGPLSIAVSDPPVNREHCNIKTVRQFHDIFQFPEIKVFFTDRIDGQTRLGTADKAASEIIRQEPRIPVVKVSGMEDSSPACLDYPRDSAVVAPGRRHPDIPVLPASALGQPYISLVPGRPSVPEDIL